MISASVTPTTRPRSTASTNRRTATGSSSWTSTPPWKPPCHSPTRCWSRSRPRWRAGRKATSQREAAMSNVPARAAYGRAAQTIPPVRQVVMLYDGALRRLREARQAILEGRIEDRFLAVQKASALIDGLHACLGFERGRDIAPLLDTMYGYIGLRLQQINIRQDPAICDELIAQLGELRRAWDTLAEGSAPFSSGPTNPTGACAAA